MTDIHHAKSRSSLAPHRTSIFQESWWLDAASPGEWREVSVLEKGKVVGRWPYGNHRVLGLRTGGMTALTSTLGPWIATVGANPVTRRKRDIAIVAALVEQLPPFWFFRQVLPPTVDNLLPFQVSGFQLDLEHTVEFGANENLSGIWSGFQDKLRNQIRATSQTEVFSPDLGFDEFMMLHTAGVRARRVEDRLDHNALRRLHQACQGRNAGRFIGLRNAHGDATAALFVVNCRERMHHLLQASHPELASPGSIQALTWNAIQLANRDGLTYDLDGVPNTGAVKRLLRYGGRLRNRFIVTGGFPGILAARTAYKLAAARMGRGKRFA